jgi:tetratricopeptide (TPR) repeat protein
MRSKWALIVAGLAVLVVGGALVYHYWPRPDPLPELDLSGAEPAVRSRIELVQARVAKRPTAAEEWGYLGQVLLAHGYDAEAMAALERASRFNPAEPRWPYLRARRLLLVDRVQGRELLEQAVRLAESANPSNVSCKLLLIDALTEQGEYEQAMTLANEVLAKESDNAPAHFFLGVGHLQRDAPEKALQHLLRAAENPLIRKRTCAQLAAVSLRLGDTVASEQFARKARELPADPPAVDPYVAEYEALASGRQADFLKAERLEAEQRAGESVRILQDLAESGPDVRSCVAFGIALVKLGNDAGAEKVLLAAVALDPDCPAAQYALGVAQFNQAEALRKRGDREAAAAKYRDCEQSTRRALVEKPDHAPAHLYLGRACQRLGQRDEAIAAFRRAIACRPEMAGPHFSLGEVLVETGQPDKARRELELAVSLAAPFDPAGKQARQLLERLDKP